FQWQVQREARALAGGALQVNLAAEQACEFTADGKAKSRAAVFAAGAGIRLLECLEDQLLLFERNADAGVGDFEGDHGRRRVQYRVVAAPAPDRRFHLELHAAFRSELEGVG